MKRMMVAAGIGALLLAGCDSPLGSRCNPIQTSIASVSGDTVTTSSGLVYVEEEIGSGPALQSCEYATLHARGRVEGGPSIFDTRASGGVWRVSPGRDDVMRGLAEGMIGMQEGGIRTLVIPPHLGYGERGDPQAGVPPNATMIWILEMVRVSEG
jgi:FKBP-type peptidyl-prolyl cis-trans isomerase